MTALPARMRTWLIIAGALIIAAVLAFPLRQTIYDMVVVPAAYLAWYLGLIYRSLSQAIWWWVILTIVLFILAFSLMPQPTLRARPRVKPKVQLGQVESLTVWLQKAQHGIYFKWLIANKLGKLAYQLLLQRESGRPRSVFAPLVGTDWQPRKELQNYLEIGLHGSFADFPQTRYPLGAPPKTPLDLEVIQAVEFLESQVENRNSRLDS